jgi:hypothetical protein
MSVDDQQWQRKNVEGALFLVRRRTNPVYQLVVLNKVSAANHAEDVRPGMELEVNAPYLMYTYGDDEVHGVWFYEKADLERVGALLQTLLREPVPLPEPSPAPRRAGGAAGASGAGDGDAFWDRQVNVTEASIPPGHAMPPPQLQPLAPMQQQQQQPQQPQSAGGGLDALLRQAQAKAGPVPGPSSMTPAPAPPPPPPQAPPALLTPSFLLASARPAAPAAVPVSASPAPAPAGPLAAAANGHTLQALLARAARPPVPPAPAPPMPPAPMSPYAPGGAGGAGASAAGGGGAGPARERLRAVLVRALQRDEVVDALAVELRAAGLMM